MVALTECLEDHGDDINLLYLTDIEAILQAIHRWIGYGAKLNLSKTPDADVLKRIIIKRRESKKTRTHPAQVFAQLFGPFSYKYWV